MLLLLVFLLGVVCGLRTFTTPAVLWIMRFGGPWAYVLAALALFEYFYDVNPKAGNRTGAIGLTFRILSGVFVGWWAAVAAGIPPTTGAVVAAVGAIAGTYGSFFARRESSSLMGNMLSGILEDIVAIAASALIVARL